MTLQRVIRKSRAETYIKVIELEVLSDRKFSKEGKEQLWQELRKESLERQIEEYEQMIGRKLTKDEIGSFAYHGIIGNKLTEDYKELLKMSGTDIMKKFVAYEV